MLLRFSGGCPISRKLLRNKKAPAARRAFCRGSRNEIRTSDTTGFTRESSLYVENDAFGRLAFDRLAKFSSGLGTFDMLTGYAFMGFAERELEDNPKRWRPMFDRLMRTFQKV